MPCREMVGGPDVLVQPYSPRSQQHNWGSHTEEYFLVGIEVCTSIFARGRRWLKGRDAYQSALDVPWTAAFAYPG